MTAEDRRELCTWRDCEQDATHPQLDNNQEQWANLCNAHAAEMDAALAAADPKALLRCWALAYGTREQFARRMMGDG